MQDREIYLADIKKRAEDFKAGNAAPAPAAAPKAKVGGFNF